MYVYAFVGSLERSVLELRGSVVPLSWKHVAEDAHLVVSHPTSDGVAGTCVAVLEENKLVAWRDHDTGDLVLELPAGESVCAPGVDSDAPVVRHGDHRRKASALVVVVGGCGHPAEQVADQAFLVADRVEQGAGQLHQSPISDSGLGRRNLTIRLTADVLQQAVSVLCLPDVRLDFLDVFLKVLNLSLERADLILK